MTDVLLGVIALATLTTALVEVVAIVGLVRIGLRVKQRLERLSQAVTPLVGHVAEVSENMAHALSRAEAQIDHVASAYAAVEVPLAKIATALGVARSVVAVIRGQPGRRAPDQSK